MKLTRNLFGIAALSLCLGFASCSDDDEIFYSDAQVTNQELRAILEKQGIQFDATGHMLLDDKVQNLTALDLTGTKFSDFQALTILPNLNELDLSNNDLGPVFDFSVLPTQITGVDLTGNDIYDFEGLVDAKVENDEVKTTIKHKLVKLHLSESAKWNVEDLMPFYTQSKAEGTTVDMQMEEGGALKPYTTLREIPDEFFRGYLKTIFSSVFADDTHIDIAKPMELKAQGQPIYLVGDFAYKGTTKIEDFTGLEYFINNPYYKKFAVAVNNFKANYKLKYVAPRANISALVLNNLSTDASIDLSKATSLSNIMMDGNQNIESVDLSNTLIGNQDIKEFDVRWGNNLTLKHCPKLADIKFGDFKYGYMGMIEVVGSPEMKKLDLSKVVAVGTFSLLQLEKCAITYPKLKYIVRNGALEEIGKTTRMIYFAISEDVFNQEATKTFIKTYRDNLSDEYREYREDGGYRWSKYL